MLLAKRVFTDHLRIGINHFAQTMIQPRQRNLVLLSCALGFILPGRVQEARAITQAAITLRQVRRGPIRQCCLHRFQN
jgi:hypothetical protein